MRKLHVIESPSHRMGGEIYYREEHYSHDPELLEAYRCGKKDGWREAMKEAEAQYHERRVYDRRRDGMFPEEPLYYREDNEWDDSYDERRRRRANGRFY